MTATTQHAFEPEELMAYLDGELEPRRAAALGSHLDHCADCHALASQIRAVTERLLDYQVEAISPSANASMICQVDERDQESKDKLNDGFKDPRKWMRLWGVPCGWAFAGALIVLLVAIWGFPSLHRSREAAKLASRTGLKGFYADESQQALTAPVGSSEPPLPGGTERGRNAEKQAPSSAQYGASDEALSEDGEEQSDKVGKSGPMIARTASLAIIVKDFGPVESAVKRIMDRYKGYIGQLSTTAQPDAARTLNAILRIPSPQLEAALAELKQLGRVEQESQSGEEVTKEYTDLAARLKNSRATEQRLLDVLRKNTGKVKDVLEVENEISRVRGEIEEMEADQRALKTRVDFATLQLSLTEDYKASLHVTPPSTMTRLHNAVVEGYRDVVERGIGLAVWLLEAGPTLLLWAAFLFFPARWIWKRWLRARLLKSALADPA
jgi:hypothetical protein